MFAREEPSYLLPNSFAICKIGYVGVPKLTLNGCTIAVGLACDVLC